MAKWEISNISVSVWLVGHQSHSILQNFTVGPASYTKYGVLCMVKCEISIISPIGLVHWLSMPGHLVKFC